MAYHKSVHEGMDIVERIQADLVAERKRYAKAFGYATRLAAVLLWMKHFEATAPEWQPLPDLLGVLTQIDNMTTGVVAAERERCAAEIGQLRTALRVNMLRRGATDGEIDAVLAAIRKGE